MVTSDHDLRQTIDATLEISMRDNMHMGCGDGFRSHVLRVEWFFLTIEWKIKWILLGHDSGILIFPNHLSAHSAHTCPPI